MKDLHVPHLETRRVREVAPLGAGEVALRARELARLHVRVRAGPRLARERPCLLVRARKTPAEPAGV
jgi:hypothetical protein